MCQWKFFVFRYKANTSASSWRRSLDISATASALKPVVVSTVFLFIVSLQVNIVVSPHVYVLLPSFRCLNYPRDLSRRRWGLGQTQVLPENPSHSHEVA